MRCLILFLLLCSTAFADMPEDLYGTWRGTRVEFFQGQTYLMRQTTVIKRERYGFSAHSIVRFGDNMITSRVEYDEDGRFESSTFFQGKTMNLGNGKWRANKSGVFAKGRAIQLGVGGYKTRTNLKLRSKRKMVAISSLSGGTTIAFTLRRR